MSDLSYRERLQQLRLYSQERRRERYYIIFIWKVAMKMTDGYSLDFSTDENRRGRLCIIKPVHRNCPLKVQRARENSLAMKGAKIFNLLPCEIRNITASNVNTFKTQLDKFLSKIPDQPTLANEGRAAETNSLLHQLPLHSANRVT